MQDICRQTGLSRGGLYRHYESTEQIFLEIVDAFPITRKVKSLLKFSGTCWLFLREAKKAAMKELHISVEKENTASIKVI